MLPVTQLDMREGTDAGKAVAGVLSRGLWEKEEGRGVVGEPGQEAVEQTQR